MKQSLRVLTLVFVAACGDDAAKSVEIADARVDAPPDAPPYMGPSLSPVGTWRTYAPDLPAGAFRAVLTLDPNGTASKTYSGGTNTGTWAIEPDGRLHLVISTDDETENYFATPDRLLTGAALPTGPVSGLVGTWDLRSTTPDFGDIRATLVLAANHTMTHVIVGGPGASSTSGTWSFDGERLHVTKQSAASFEVPAIPGLVIGQGIYEKVSP